MRQDRAFSRSFLRTRRASGRRTSARPLTAGRPYRIALPRLVAGRYPRRHAALNVPGGGESGAAFTAIAERSPKAQ